MASKLATSKITSDHSDLLLKLSNYRLTKLREISKQLGMHGVQGKKQEVISKLYELIKSPEGMSKIKQLKDQEFISQILNWDQLTSNTLIPQQGETLQTLGNATIMNQGKTINVKCICAQGMKPLIQCSTCKNWQHTKCMEKNCNIKPYECILCQAVKINPFYEVVNVLLPPYKIISYPEAQYLQERASMQFSSSSEIKNLIISENGSLQIQIRCFKIDGVGYEHTWPKFGSLLFNQQLISEFKVSENPNAKKRKDECINITMLVQIGINSIEIIQQQDAGSYCGMVFLVRVRDVSYVIQHVKANNFLPEIVCREKLKRYFRIGDGEDDELICDEGIIVNVKCPLSFQFIKTPVRGKKCKHIQPFNLESFVEVSRNAKVRKWHCPVCAEKAFEMEIDGFFQKIFQVIFQIKEINQNETVQEVKIFADGSYNIIFEKEDQEEEENDKEGNKRKRSSSENSNTQIPQIQNEIFTIETEDSKVKKRKTNDSLISTEEDIQKQKSKEELKQVELQNQNSQQKQPTAVTISDMTEITSAQLVTSENQDNPPSEKQNFLKKLSFIVDKKENKNEVRFVGTQNNPIELE